MWILDGQRIDIRAGIHTLGGYSAHADQKDLLNFIGRMRQKPRQVRLVHGDNDGRGGSIVHPANSAVQQQALALFLPSGFVWLGQGIQIGWGGLGVVYP
jgi:predicted metal-dependent RNase